MLRVAHVQNIEAPAKEKRLTKREREYLDSLNWVTQQKALDRKEARKFFVQEAEKIEIKKPPTVIEGLLKLS